VQRVVISGTDLGVSRFIFGTGSLFSAGGSRARRKLLSVAYAHGFTHFDTAPYYGFGLAERDLGELLAAHPEVTVTTKVGMYSPGGEWQSEFAVLRRKVSGRVLSACSRARADWNVVRARQSLDDSLRRLNRERIDFYALHEPDLALIETDEWLRWLEREIVDGRVRYYGVAGDASKLKPWLEHTTLLPKIVQTKDSLSAREANLLSINGRPFQITYGYVSSAVQNGYTNVAEVLRQALKRNKHGAILVSTRKISRLPQYESILNFSTHLDDRNAPARLELFRA
jgi:aryl-alcohol dehydrogenase-like predicted oxidoreductase